jgi:hypothetical protein
MERRTVAVQRARLRSRASRFSCACEVAAVFRHGAFEFAWSVPFLARFFDNYIPRRCAKPTERAHTTDRERERARSPDYACRPGFCTPLRRCCLYHQVPGSDAAGGGGLPHARSARRTRRAGCGGCHSRTFARAPDRRPARGNPQALEVKLYAVLQLPGGKVSGG